MSGTTTAGRPATEPQVVDRWRLTRWLVAQTRGLLAPLTFSVLARIAGMLLGVALLVVAATAVARIAVGDPVALLGLVGQLVGLSLAKALLRYLEHYAGHWVAFSALARLREVFFARLVPQAPAATQGRAGAELTDRATRDIDRIESFFAHTFPPGVAAIVVPIVSLAWLAVAVDATLALVIAPFVVGVALLVPLLSSRRTWRLTREVAGRRGDLATHVGDDVQGVREVLAFDLGERRLAGLDAADRVLSAARTRSAALQAVRSGGIATLNGAVLVAVLVTGGAIGSSVVDVAAALAVAVSLWGPSRGVDDFVASLDAAYAAAARVREVADAAPLVREPAHPRTIEAAAGARVDVTDVTFRYPGRTEPAVADLSLEFAAGSWTCLVGVSGSGKSTLASLLARGWDPVAGEIRLAGVNVADLTLDDLRACVTLVPQRPTVLRGTIADNLRLGVPDASTERLRAAVATAALDTWIDGLPDGLDTPIRERGLNVSGGELQRLALARALVGTPRVLVLDEGLSQLDAATAAAVRERLGGLQRTTGMTVVEITHRADLIPDTVRAVVLDAGRVHEQGPAGSLRGAGGAFDRVAARA
ncbi:ABC transporter ATP-binding protein [Propionicicella superfundia]|uniref:ABC transporter ATP-binding protein n=1 Tax=Propionicicella superfundia TaxID=348582 RepID=UPI00040164A6|nr:ABC transporter ATP-binding protein [Propionicicella superfundia]